ncbi:MAG: hypothetical protein H6765_07375 [Candidatus Peribacteria bacterium]|nr:MAG: hypothetical protein H6765_07375 [Candidatus Peribacteria bacterium]
MALPFVLTKGDKPIWVNEGIPVIAPLKMKYQLNKEQFDRNILPKLGTNQVDTFELDCGNGYKLQGTRQMYLNTNGYFPEHCLYLEKGVYPVSMTVRYFNRTTGEPQSQTFKMYDLTV